MGTARRQYTDEFKLEAVGLLASSGRPLSQIAQELGIAASRLRAWRNMRDRRGAPIHRGRYGAPRIHAALYAEGHAASRSRVERLMRHHGIRAITPRRFRVCTTDSRHNLPVAPNRLNQKFAAERPNQIWLADVTYVPTKEGWLYLAVVLDLFTRKIVGWAMRDHMRAELTIAALTMAIQRQKPPPGLIHHSDRGSQYAAADYHKVLSAAGMIPSMSRKGNCWDNAPMESCFGTLKTELVHRACYPTRDAARHDLFAYIEGYYNRQFIPPSGISPPNRRSAKPLNPGSTKSGEGQTSPAFKN